MNNRERPSYRRAVTDVQTYLYYIAQIDSDIPRVNPDGIYGETTAASVATFQRKYLGHTGHIADGRVDYPTFRRLLEEFRKAEAHLGDPARLAPFRGRLKNRKLIYGDRSDLVMLVRLMLDTIGLTYRSAEALPITDRYDEALVDAIRTFQITQGLPPDGEIGRETWDRLAIAYNQNIGNTDS